MNALSLVGLGMHLSFLDVLPFWDSSGLDPKVAIFESHPPTLRRDPTFG